MDRNRMRCTREPSTTLAVFFGRVADSPRGFGTVIFGRAPACAGAVGFLLRTVNMHTVLRRVIPVLSLPLIAVPLHAQGRGAASREPAFNVSTNPLLSSFRFRSIGPASMGGRID